MTGELFAGYSLSSWFRAGYKGGAPFNDEKKLTILFLLFVFHVGYGNLYTACKMIAIALSLRDRMKFKTQTTSGFMSFVTMMGLWFVVWFATGWLHNYY
ncbi:hypothetical protein [Escherichia sp. TW09308]|uniref:hypothetical protein n=1 Tax=Escherichia sp. TW09308 TaxID=754331 RepID=UPI0002482795|nr:hypothetical protein [Escherichia sp. TW09308]